MRGNLVPAGSALSRQAVWGCGTVITSPPSLPPLTLGLSARMMTGCWKTPSFAPLRCPLTRA